MRKFVFFLLLINLFLALAGWLLIKFTFIEARFDDILFGLAGFSVISYVMVSIFFRGQEKEPQSRVLYTLVSLGLKFLLDLIFALIWFVVAKKNSTVYVFVFFVLYLTLTLYSVLYVLKYLKNKLI